MRMQLGLWEYCLVGGEIKKKMHKDCSEFEVELLC